MSNFLMYVALFLATLMWVRWIMDLVQSYQSKKSRKIEVVDVSNDTKPTDIVVDVKTVKVKEVDQLAVWFKENQTKFQKNFNGSDPKHPIFKKI